MACAPPGVVLANGAGTSSKTTFSSPSPVPGAAPLRTVAAVLMAAAVQTGEAACMSAMAVAEHEIAGGGTAEMNRVIDRNFGCDKDLHAPGSVSGAASRLGSAIWSCAQKRVQTVIEETYVTFHHICWYT